MTVETRTTAEPRDIQAIEVECSLCHEKIVKRLDNWRNSLQSCGNCGTSWMASKSFIDTINALAFQLHALSQDGAEKLPFKIRLESRNVDGK